MAANNAAVPVQSPGTVSAISKQLMVLSYINKASGRTLEATGLSGSWQPPLALSSKRWDVSFLNNILILSRTNLSFVPTAVSKEIIMRSPTPSNHLPHYFPSQAKELGGSLTAENTAEGKRSLELLFSRASERANNTQHWTLFNLHLGQGHWSCNAAPCGWVNMDKSYSLERLSHRGAERPAEKATHSFLHGRRVSSLLLLHTWH